MRNAIWSVDKDQTVAHIDTMDHIVAEAVARQRFSMLLLGLFAALALLLASIGIYGVMSYSVAQRTREIGIRMALGARRADVLQMTVKQALKLVGAGMMIGLAAAFLLTRVMASLLLWDQCDRSNYVHWHLCGAARSRNPRQLRSGASRDEGRPDNRVTRAVDGIRRECLATRAFCGCHEFAVLSVIRHVTMICVGTLPPS